ncbi:MAG: methyl-accepting chemotaxis protein, partial [Smithella sp.]
VSKMLEEIGNNFDAEKNMLSSILINFDQIRSPLIHFEKVARNLNTLCSFIKIETALLGDSGGAFNTLSEDVRRLASLISTKTGNLIDKTDTLIPALKKNISLIDNYKSQQEYQSRVVLDKINNNLTMMSQRKDFSSATVQDISIKWQHAAASISEIVQSMQIHDITRQRIEHSCNALKNLKQRAATIKHEQTPWRIVHNLFKNNSNENVQNSPVRAPLANLIVDTCNLQCAQLVNAKNDFANAIKHILENLNNVSFYAGSISEEIMKISGNKNGRKDSFLLDMEKDVDYLSNSIGAFARIKKDLSEAMNEMTEAATAMSGYMKEMEKISIEMQTLALNASIHAAHIGDRGLTLSTLADSIHWLAVETASMVTTIVTNLKEAIVSSEKLAQMANVEIEEGNTKTIQIKNNLDQILLPLKAIDAEIEELLPHIDQLGQTLSMEIQALVSEINIHHYMISNIENVEVSLKNTIKKIKVKNVESLTGERSSLLKELSSQYTMDSERETHLAVAGTIPAAVSLDSAFTDSDTQPAETCTTSDKDNDLGDNVELF